MKQESNIIEILRDENLRKELDQVSALMQEHLLVILEKVYQSGIEEGIRISRETGLVLPRGEVS